jgi:hypothetical protein
VIHSNHVSILSDFTLHSVCSAIYHSAVAAFAIPGSQKVLAPESSLAKVLSAIFDNDHRAFVLEDSDRILAVLDGEAKGCILTQAIAGMLFILCRLAATYPQGAAHGELTAQAFERELRRFARSEQRTSILEKIEKSHLWGNCFAKIELRDLIMEALKTAREETENSEDPLSPALELEDDIPDPVAWVNEQRPIRDLGVPEGLTIMALN